jgi:hypothetical protein
MCYIILYESIDFQFFKFQIVVHMLAIMDVNKFAEYGDGRWDLTFWHRNLAFKFLHILYVKCEQYMNQKR